MRAGVCSVQQALTPEAKNLVKQAVGLSRRRGHAQVTPLHVASAMLATSTSLLRRACVQSHSHPLQFRALELCFNVALNRLPASTSGVLLNPHSGHHNPSLSNALVATFKRAQAHQRRGSIENQQQPILALKIELEHLIVSILDDPSVSRVMREAGFSSTQVKTKVEQTVSMDVSKPIDQERKQDITHVLNTIVNKRRNIVVVGDCVGTAESVVKEVMNKFEKGQVSGDFRYLQFINLPLFSLRNLVKYEVEQKLLELKCLVKSYMGRGVVLYLGDLNWVSDFWSKYGEQRRNYYCPVEHIIMEIKRLVFGMKENAGKLFLMGIASFQTYMKCKSGHPSLETMWELYPLTISADSLSLSLNLDSDSHPQHIKKESIDGIHWSLPGAPEIDKKQTSFNDRLLLSFNKEAKSNGIISSSSNLPSWIQSYKQESKNKLIHNEDSVYVKGLYKKCNSLGSSAASNPEEALYISPLSSPPKSTYNDLSWPTIFESKNSPKEHQFWISDDDDDDDQMKNDPKPDLLSNPNSSPNSASSSEAIEEDIDGLNEFKILNPENLSILCKELEKKVPWQKEKINEIANTILECRSGMAKVKNSWLKKRSELKEETWLFFIGDDCEAKQKIARELARLIFGSQTNFVPITTSSDEKHPNNNKRKRDYESDSSYVQRFGEALNQNSHRVFFLEDFEQVDYCSQNGIKEAIESGRLTLSDEDQTVSLKDSIIIFSSESYRSVSRSKICDQTDQENYEEDKNSYVGLDLNIAIQDEEDSSGGCDGILEYVDKQIIFRVQEQ